MARLPDRGQSLDVARQEILFRLDKNEAGMQIRNAGRNAPGEISMTPLYGAPRFWRTPKTSGRLGFEGPRSVRENAGPQHDK